jgi:hypothetical protein
VEIEWFTSFTRFVVIVVFNKYNRRSTLPLFICVDHESMDVH